MTLQDLHVCKIYPNAKLKRFMETYCVSVNISMVCLTGVLILYFIACLIFYPVKNISRKEYVEATSISATIEDSGDSWIFNLENGEVLEALKKESNPLYEAGQEVELITTTDYKHLISKERYTLDGISVYDNTGEKIGAAVDIGYHRFVSAEDYNAHLEQFEEVKDTLSYKIKSKLFPLILLSLLFCFLSIAVHFKIFENLDNESFGKNNQDLSPHIITIGASGSGKSHYINRSYNTGYTSIIDAKGNFVPKKTNGEDA